MDRADSFREDINRIKANMPGEASVDPFIAFALQYKYAMGVNRVKLMRELNAAMDGADEDGLHVNAAGYYEYPVVGIPYIFGIYPRWQTRYRVYTPWEKDRVKKKAYEPIQRPFVRMKWIREDDLNMAREL